MQSQKRFTKNCTSFYRTMIELSKNEISNFVSNFCEKQVTKRKQDHKFKLRNIGPKRKLQCACIAILSC